MINFTGTLDLDPETITKPTVNNDDAYLCCTQDKQRVCRPGLTPNISELNRNVCADQDLNVWMSQNETGKTQSHCTAHQTKSATSHGQTVGGKRKNWTHARPTTSIVISQQLFSLKAQLFFLALFLPIYSLWIGSSEKAQFLAVLIGCKKELIPMMCRGILKGVRSRIEHARRCRAWSGDWVLSHCGIAVAVRNNSQCADKDWYEP